MKKKKRKKKKKTHKKNKKKKKNLQQFQRSIWSNQKNNIEQLQNCSKRQAINIESVSSE